MCFAVGSYSHGGVALIFHWRGAKFPRRGAKDTTKDRTNAHLAHGNHAALSFRMFEGYFNNRPYLIIYTFLLISQLNSHIYMV